MDGDRAICLSHLLPDATHVVQLSPISVPHGASRVGADGKWHQRLVDVSPADGGSRANVTVRRCNARRG
jgi:hypothetical protein